MSGRDLEALSRDELIAEVRALEARHLRLHDDCPVALLLLDEKGVVQLASRSAAQLLQRRQTALTGKPFIAVAPMRDPAPFWRHLERCVQEGATVTTEVELLGEGGRSRTLQMTSAPSPDPTTGRPTVAMSLVDIEGHVGARREAQHAHAEERRLRARLEAQVRAGAAIGEAQSTMHLHGVSSVLRAIAEQARHLVDAEMAALGMGGAPGQSFEYWAESGVSEEVYAAIGRGPPPRVGVLEAVAAGRVVRTADVTRHPSFSRMPAGHPAIGSFLGVPIRHRDRAVGNLYVANKRIGTEFDEDDERSLVLLAEYAALVIESTLATDAEIRERSRLRAILDQLPESVIVKDTHTHLIPNMKALEFAVEAHGRVDPFGNPVQWDARRADGSPFSWEELPLTRAFRDGVLVSDVEMTLATADGRLVEVLANASPLVDDAGRPLGAVVVWREIEQVKRLERLREEWAAVVAHDLRQPLSIIRTWDQVLAHAARSQQETFERAVDTIDRAAVRMSEMIEELLDSSLLEARRLTLRTEPLQLEELVRDSVEALAPEDRALHLEVGPHLPQVQADRSRLTRVIENLISNAFKYGTAGTDVRVTVTLQPGGVEVAVTNTGKELSPAEIQRLFSRFYRASTAARQRGLGLGLYIAHGIIAAHGGRLECESGRGRTTFRFTIPARPVAPVEAHVPP